MPLTQARRHLLARVCLCVCARVRAFLFPSPTVTDRGGDGKLTASEEAVSEELFAAAFPGADGQSCLTVADAAEFETAFGSSPPTKSLRYGASLCIDFPITVERRGNKAVVNGGYYLSKSWTKGALYGRW